MIKFKYIAAVLLILITGCASEQLSTEENVWETPELIKSGLINEYTDSVLENDRLALSFNKENGFVTITDKKTGLRYDSNPLNIEEDTVSRGINKLELSSQISLTVMDINNQNSITNSTSECGDGGFGYELKENKLIVTYYFKNSGFIIPLNYELTEDGALSVSVSGEEIELLGTNKIFNLSVLPYFGSANSSENGYMFVPDGSGAIIQFNSEKSLYQSYSQPIYGRDNSLTTQSNAETKQIIQMPVFGMSKDKGGFLAVVTNGEAAGQINADIGGKKTGFNTVYSSIRCIQSETERFMAGTANATDMPMYSEFMPPPEYRVNYYFLGEENNTFIDMADIYTDYLINNGMEKSGFENVYKTHLDFYGAVPVTKTLFGIPYTAPEILTAIEDIIKIANELTDFGNFDIRYLGWYEGGLEGKTLNSVKAENGIGGNNGIIRLQKELSMLGIGFHLDADMVNLYKNGNGYNTTFDVVKNISRAPSLQYQYMLSTGSKKLNISPWYLLKPEKSAQGLKSLVSSMLKEGFNSIALSGMTNQVYTNFDKDGTTRERSVEIFKEAFQDAGENLALQMESPLGYAIPFAESAVNVPVASSGFDVEYIPVPFYSAALSGIIPCYSQPINLRGDSADYILQVIAAGVNPNFSLIGKSNSLLSDSRFNYLYSVGYDTWKDTIKSLSERMTKELLPTVGKRMKDYTVIEENVTITSYDDVKVYVNRNTCDITVGSILIPAMDFVVEVG